MPVEAWIQCPRCETRLRGATAAPGAVVRCPKCSASFIPQQSRLVSEEGFLDGLGAIADDSGEPIQVFRGAATRKPASHTDLKEADVHRHKTRARIVPRQYRFPAWSWAGFGLVGGALASMIWITLAIATDSRPEYFTLLVALFCGLGVRLVAGERRGWRPALVTLLCAVLLITFTQPAICYLLARNAACYFPNGKIDARAMIIRIAHEVAQGLQQKGIPIAWPKHVPAGMEASYDDFPEEIIDSAERIWDAKGPNEQQEEMNSASRRLNAVHGYRLSYFFTEAFRTFDAIWIGLALAIAFKAGWGPTV